MAWYSGQFWALYFLQQVSKADALTSAYIVGAALLIATPSLIFFGWLSDIIGRKPVILGGMLLAAITYPDAGNPYDKHLGADTEPYPNKANCVRDRLALHTLFKARQ